MAYGMEHVRLSAQIPKHVDGALREFTADPEEIDALAGGVEGIDFAGIELREAQEIEIERLREHLDAGRITEADFLLLIGTRVYGKSVADYAPRGGPGLPGRQETPPAGRGRHPPLREGKAGESRGGLSPRGGLIPPLVLGGE